MKVRIVSDGTPWGTEIVNAETGERIDHVASVQITMLPNDPVIVILKMRNVELDITGYEPGDLKTEANKESE